MSYNHRDKSILFFAQYQAINPQYMFGNSVPMVNLNGK